MPHYTFGPFELNPEARVLRRDGEPVPLSGKTLDTLVVLVENRGRLVDKDELLSRVWAGTVVEEANLTQSIFSVRKVLGDSPKDHRYIATVAGRGYQFVSPVTEVTSATLAPAEVRTPRQEEHGVVAGFIKRKKAVALAVVAVVMAGVGWFVLRRSPKQPAELRQRRLTFNSSANSVVSGAMSPDGNYLAYSDSAGIHLKLLSTGEERTIPKPGGIPADALCYVDSWFPDGTQLLAHSRQRDGHGSMWTVSVMGQSSRELRRDALGWGVSLDGGLIVFSPTQPFENLREIWVMDSEGNSPRKIVGRAANEWLWSARWSPDGQRLAYIRAQHLPNKYFQFIETCNLKARTGRRQWLCQARIRGCKISLGSRTNASSIHASQRMAQARPISGKSVSTRSTARQRTNQYASRTGPNLICWG